MEESAKNVFGETIPCLEIVLQQEDARNFVQATLCKVLAGLEANSSRKIIEKLVKTATTYSLSDYEQIAHRLLQEKGITPQKISKRLSDRAQLVYEQIRPHLPKEGTVLDLGCGDGKIGKLVSETGLETTLTDVYKHPHVEKTGLEFIGPFAQGSQVPTPTQYDVTLLLTVLHHSDDPYGTFREAVRLTKEGGKILVIESVYGIDASVEETDAHGNRFNYLKEEAEELTYVFKSLATETQRRVNIFFDHFYNRVIHNPANDVNVPWNFCTPETWKNIFETTVHDGKRPSQKKVEYLGCDQPTVPEYHTLHVLVAEKTP